MNIAIIPARGGSKRIPRKNVRSFCGKPILAYSIETALASGLFDHVIVSTDDAEIATVAKNHGAEVPFMRPSSLADDYAGTLAVMQHAVLACRELGWMADYFCCLYATAPFVLGADLQSGFQALASDNQNLDTVEYVFSATSFDFPVQRAIRINTLGRVEPVWPENIPKRSQDLEPLYHDAGQFYWGKAHAFQNLKPLFAAHSKAVLIPQHRVQDIDTEHDWIRAEWMYGAWKNTTLEI